MKTLTTYGGEIINLVNLCSLTVNDGGVVAATTAGNTVVVLPQRFFGDDPHKTAKVFVATLNAEMTRPDYCAYGKGCKGSTTQLYATDILRLMGAEQS